MKNVSTNVKLLAVLGLLGLAAAYLLVWKPKASDLSDTRHENVTLNQELATLTAAAAPSSSSTTVPAATKALDLAIPSQPDLANLLRQVSTIATATGVDQKSLTPAPASAVAAAPGSSMGVTISATGPRSAVYEYVRLLSTMQRLFVVDKVSMQLVNTSGGGQGQAPTSGTNSYQVDLSGRVFTLSTPATAAATNG